MLNQTIKHARRVVIAVVGFTLVTIGIVMLVTPGPGWAMIFFGLSVLAVEFVWARRLLKRLKRAGSDVASSIFGKRKQPQDKEASDKSTSDDQTREETRQSGESRGRKPWQQMNSDA